MTGAVLEGQATLPDGSALFAPLRVALVARGWTCLLGPSGCGKSTILRLLAGLETEVRFEGAVTGTEGGAAYMAQSDLLMPWLSVLGNVTLGARLRGETPDQDRAQAMIAAVGLADRAAHRPGALSGGQRQRVALARTLMEDRPVVLLDEPFSALDAQTRAEMQDLAAEVLKDRTVLIVTHDPLEAARLGDQILLMGPEGLDTVPPPGGPAIRAVEDPEVLQLQARLMTRLRRAA